MDTLSEKVLMQKMFECVEAQVEVLKKIISHPFGKGRRGSKKDKANHGQSELTQEDLNRMMTEGNVRLLLQYFMPLMTCII